MEIFLLIFGLGFFLFVIGLLHSWEQESYHRRIAERREFGAPIDHKTSKRT